jgi:hypothetical protein
MPYFDARIALFAVDAGNIFSDVESEKEAADFWPRWRNW